VLEVGIPAQDDGNFRPPDLAVHVNTDAVIIDDAGTDNTPAQLGVRHARGGGARGRRAMRIPLTCAEVRSWRESDAESLALHANDREVWRNMSDRFPHPYTAADARAFLQSAMARVPESWFAIAVDDQAVGGIGFTPQGDIQRVSAEIGYWLGVAFWGRGIVSEALRAVTRYAVQTHGLTRVFAVPFAWNAASFRVLEKAGFTREARLRRSAIKDGRVIDQMLYAFVVPEAEPPRS
jgi:RimJ/RimL family protein N-acetyltransferase